MEQRRHDRKSKDRSSRTSADGTTQAMGDRYQQTDGRIVYLRPQGAPVTSATKMQTVVAPAALRASLANQETPAAGPRTRSYEIAKRLLDVALGVTFLVISLPIILVAALLIRLESRGSPFFIQKRLGKGGKPFRIVKLRGMYIDARQRFPQLYDYSNNKDLDFHFHYKTDPRVTRAGTFFRRTSIDELPNFWNVVIGDMSLVGPRPDIPEILALYGSYREEYLSVKPGITCLSKCTGRDVLTKRESIEYDLQYIRRRSFLYDMVVLWRTFCGVVTRRDVY